MKIATTTGDLDAYASSFSETVSLFKGTGFRHLDVNFYSSFVKPDDPLFGDDWTDIIDDMLRRGEELGIDFVQAHSPNYNPFDPNADHERWLLAMNRSIEACGRLGIPDMVVHSGISADILYPAGREEYFRLNREFYSKLFPAMEKFGVHVLIENSAEANMGGRYFFMTGEEMRDFVEYVDHPLLQACWDTGHANMRGSDQYQDILAMGSHLRAIHFQDNFGARDEHFAPFMGSLDIDAIMQGLLAVGYQGALTFEANNLLKRAGSWPHPRLKSPSVTDRRLASPPLDLRIRAEAFLYEIGKSIFTAYGCYED